MRLVGFFVFAALVAIPAVAYGPSCRDNRRKKIMGKWAEPLGYRDPKEVMWRFMTGKSTKGHKGPAMGEGYICMHNERYDGYITTVKPSKQNWLVTGGSCGYDQQVQLEVFKDYGYAKTWRMRSKKGYRCAQCRPNMAIWEWDEDECGDLSEVQFWIAQDETVAIQHCATGKFLQEQPPWKGVKCWADWRNPWYNTRVWWAGWKVGTKEDWKAKKLWKQIGYGESCSGMSSVLGVKATYGSTTSTTVGSSNTVESQFNKLARALCKWK
ncbi:hypothetical protein BSKO_02289 [Bryopsis sp. KO-2023]|nr:hypothetical protein BSKO_02289 [Bryopsis sp. KO-2023]